MGENAQTLNKYENEEYLSFRLSDDPLDNNCDYLFGGDGISISVFGHLEPRSESLMNRLSRIKYFFEEIFSTSKIKEIILDINYELFNDNDSREILIDDFVKSLYLMYMQNKNITPNVQLCIRKDKEKA